MFSNHVLIQMIILVFGLSGFMIARYIYSHKVKQTPLICPMNFDCHSVVHSDYSKFLGVPVEIFGMIYYACISVTYLLLVIGPYILPSGFSSPLFFLLTPFLFVASSGSFFAFLFSLYLIYVQIFVLKKGCSWCILSALISALIFILSFS